MLAPENILEIFLQPGDFYWGDANTRIRTILGSCIAICMWHPTLKEGGMCHFMLPSRGRKLAPGEKLQGKYADEAWEMFLLEMKKNKTKPTDYVVKIFGGANMFASEKQDKDYISRPSIGEKNIEIVRKIVKAYNLRVVSENLGGTKSRRIHFDIWSGNVWLKSQD